MKIADPEIVGVFLKEDSEALLRRKLNGLGVTVQGKPVVAINSSPTAQDRFMYEPLYGERAAFRLTQIVSNKNGIRGLGRVSTMMGPVADDAHPTTIILSTEPSEARLTLVEPNLLLEGRICSSKYMYGGQCTFDRSDITGTEAVPGASGNAATEEGVEGECPICRFMKGGPCGAEFEGWSKCMEALQEAGDGDVTKCAKVTHAMSTCMRQSEYYDIFIAGMTEKFESIEQPQEVQP